ncbi:MAG: hypothetical protein ACM3JD_08225 [Rudaea sp.]
MSSQEVKVKNDSARDAQFWAQPMTTLHVTDVPQGAKNLNMEGRQVLGPLQGFGRMWQRTYRVRLDGLDITPQQIVADWKKNFAVFQPANNHFYPSMAGIKPGEMVFIDTTLPVIPGRPGILPIAVGVMVLYADDTTFTVMTPEGHPFAGWNTFSAYEEDGVTYAQVQALCRPSDPIYEFGYRFMGGEPEEDKVWYHVLRSVAGHWGLHDAAIEFNKNLVDDKVQWSQWKNIWKNAAVRTTIYLLASPIRWARGK